MQKLLVIGALTLSVDAAHQAKHEHQNPRARITEFRSKANNMRTKARAEHANRMKQYGKDGAMSAESLKLAAELDTKTSQSNSDAKKFFELYTYFPEMELKTHDGICARQGLQYGGNGFVDGFEMFRCQDYIYAGDGEDFGYAESEIMRYPNNGGFPIVSWFEGHGCKGEAVDHWRMSKRDFGFGDYYQVGECVGDDYVTLQALWREKKHEPFRDHVADSGYDSKHKGCTNDKLGTYLFDYYGDCRSWWEPGYTVDCEVWLGSLQYTDREGNIHADFEKSACHGYQSGPGGPA